MEVHLVEGVADVVLGLVENPCDQLLLSLNKSNRFRKLLCSGAQCCKFR